MFTVTVFESANEYFTAVDDVALPEDLTLLYESGDSHPRFDGPSAVFYEFSHDVSWEDILTAALDRCNINIMFT